MMRRAAFIAAVILGLSACGGSTPDVSDEIVVPTLVAPTATATETAHQRAVKTHKRAVAAHKQHLREQQDQETAITAYPGAFCSSPGSHGIASNGSTYTCKGPGQERWRR